MSQARGLNNRGEVVGSGANGHARLYSGGVMIDLGTNTSTAVAINDSGQVVGPFPSGAASGSVFKYEGGAFSDLFRPFCCYVQPNAINNSGEVVANGTGDHGQMAFLYSSGVWTNITSPLSTVSSYPAGINSSGQILINQIPACCGGVRGAYLYSDGVLTGMGFGGITTDGYGLNESGQVVGRAEIIRFSGVIHAFLFSGGVTRDLGTLGGASSTANAINNNGQIVGTSTTSNGTPRAFIYSNGTMRDLNSAPDLMVTRLEWDTTPGALTFAYTNSITPVGGGSACSPVAINDGGQILCSGGRLLTPVAPSSTTAKLYWATGLERSNKLSNTAIFTHTIPAGFTGGSAPIQVPASSLQNRPTNATHVLLVLNPDNQLTEANTNNNTAALDLTKPDLLAWTLAWNPPEDGLSFAYTVQSGTIPRVPTTAELFWANGAAISNKISSALFTHSIPASFEGQSSNIHAPASVFSNPPTNATHVLLVVDSPKLVDESSENNNVMAVMFTRPDLVPAYFGWAATGDALEIAYAVQPGNIPRGSTTAKLFWANGPAASDLLSTTSLFTTNIPAGASGRSSNITASATILQNPPANATHVLLVVDPDNVVAESSETNNTLTLGLCDHLTLRWASDVGGTFRFDDAANWSPPKVPRACDIVELRASDPAQRVIEMTDRSTHEPESHEVAQLIVDSGKWNLYANRFLIGPSVARGKITVSRSLDVYGELSLVFASVTTPEVLVYTEKKLSVSDSDLATDRLTLWPGATLLVDGEVDGASIKTPQLEIVSECRLGWRKGTIEVDGDLIFNDSHKLEIEINPSESGSSVPLLKVTAGHRFEAGGELSFVVTGQTPDIAAGQRFRLVEFKAETKNVEEIYNLYRFKNYDPSIPGHDNLIWGLAYRQESFDELPNVISYGAQFIELLVLEKPRRAAGLGEPLTPSSGRDGLVLVTHGSNSEIDRQSNGALTNDGSFAEIATKIRVNTASIDPQTWDVVTVDWSGFSTHPGDSTLNFATSAQVAIGIGESLHHWFTNAGFHYSKMHLLSHSSGCWLINRLMQFQTTSAAVHLTFFDAFTNPGADSGLYSGRFSGTELGLGSDANDFVEHYVDRSPVSPPGTSATLRDAVNFDVTHVSIMSDPYSTSILDPRVAHAWPYKWYLETIRWANQDPTVPVAPGAYCGGYLLSQEFLDGTPDLNLRASISMRRDGLRVNDDILIGGFPFRIWDGSWTVQGTSCQAIPILQFTPTGGGFIDAVWGSIGHYVRLLSGALQMTTGPSSSPTTNARQWAAVTNDVYFQHTGGGIAFDYQFTGSATGTVSVFADGLLIGVLNQGFSGTNLLSTGNLELGSSFAAGVHQLVFVLESDSDDSAQAVLSNFRVGYDPHSVIVDQQFLPNRNLQLTLQGVPNRAYTIEGALSITGPWTNLGTVLVGANGLGVFTDTNLPSSWKFYRANASQPSVLTPLQNLTNIAGNSLTLAASVSGTPTLYLQWLKDGVLLEDATNSTLTVSSLTTNDSGHYSIVVSNSHGVVESAIANLTVLVPAPAVDFNAPGSFNADASYSMGFEFDALQAVTVTALGMYDDGTNGFAESHDVGLFSNNGVLLASTTVFSTNQLIGYFRYQKITPLKLPAGSGYRIAAVTGTEPFTWAPSGPTTNALIRFVRDRYTSRETNLVFPSSSDGSMGYFGANFLLTTSTALPDLPVITTQPTNRNAAVGATATFTVAATGTAPLAYRWRKDGVNLNDGANIGGATTTTLRLTNVTALSAGSYDVVVANSYGSVTSQLANLTVFLPTLRLGPVSRGADSFGTGVSGTPGDTVWILRSLKLVPPWTPIGTVTFGANGMAMFIDTNPPASSAFYRASPVLPVLPAITTQPTNRNAVGGATVTFTVVANGAAPLGYFWRKWGAALSNSANLSGAASPTLSITNIQFTDSGNYDVVVTNYYGGVTSQVASLTVAISDPPTAAMDFTAPGGLYTDASYSMGFEFDALQAITVTALGMFDEDANGFAESHDVGIFSINGTLLASTTVFSTNQLIGYFRYQQIPPLNLPAGSGYRVAAVTGTERYTWAPSGPTTNALIRFVRARYTANTTNLVFPTGSDAVLGYFGANFLLTVSTNQPP